MQKPINSILVKPAGPDCNLACTYCFYLEKSALFKEQKVHRMSEEILEETIKQCMDQSGPQVSFGWQGGEPTLMGLPFFEKAVELQKRYGRSQTVGNGLQTNGILIDEDWSRFLAKYNFLVGLSLDGPEHVHDRYRKMTGGQATFAKVADRARLMLDAGVAVNALSVVNDYSVEFPEETYAFLKELGLEHLQFIPIVERDRDDPDRPAPFSVPPEKYGAFLCRLFDLWLEDFEGGKPTTSIRFFDSVFHIYAGLTPPECTLLEECGVYVVVEHNGDVFACDFFVEDRWKLGNVSEGRLIDFLNSERQVEFGLAKSDLNPLCLECAYLRYCRGGCPKDRILRTDGPDMNHLCESFKSFFGHAHDCLKKMARAWMKEQEQHQEAERRAFYQRKEAARPGTGRNDPCPCGSGLKFKKCCGRCSSAPPA